MYLSFKPNIKTNILIATITAVYVPVVSKPRLHSLSGNLSSGHQAPESAVGPQVRGTKTLRLWIGKAPGPRGAQRLVHLL